MVLAIFVGIPALLNMRRRNGVWALLEARGFVVVRRPSDRDNQLLARLIDAVPEPWPQSFWRRPRNVRTRIAWIAVSDDALIAEHRFDAHKRFPRYVTSMTTFEGIPTNALKPMFERRVDSPIPDADQASSDDLARARELGTLAQTGSVQERLTANSITKVLDL